MQQLTVRGFDSELERRLRQLAERQGLSLSQAAVRLMRLGAGLTPEPRARDVIGHSLDPFFDTWTAEEEREFLESIDSCEQIDEELWR